jgi:hypothetical protein
VATRSRGVVRALPQALAVQLGDLNGGREDAPARAARKVHRSSLTKECTVKMRQIVPLTLAGLLVALSVPAVASATALVDDPAVADKLPARAKTYFAKREAEFQLWRPSRRGPETSHGTGSSSASRAWAASYRILSTTSHKQLRNDYCVPATTAIIDHYLRGARRHWSQHRWAAYRYAGVPLWTDARGGSMWVMAMGLR